MKDTKQMIRAFIAESILFDSHFPYSDDASFLEEGIVDSMGIMELVAFVDENFGFTVQDED